MVLIIIAVLLIIAGGIGLWKGPVAKSADSLQQSGSGKTEAYVIIILLAVVFGAALYLIIFVV